jgi:riboflavin kinase
LLASETANLPEDVAESAASVLESGIYFGWAKLQGYESVYPMVMSYGWNPFYKNEKRTAVCALLSLRYIGLRLNVNLGGSHH